jgi:hypothetical protein
MRSRPKLNQVPLPFPFPVPGRCYITMSPGQWDALLQCAYDANWTLLEVDLVNGEEKIVRAFRKCHPPTN